MEEEKKRWFFGRRAAKNQDEVETVAAPEAPAETAAEDTPAEGLVEEPTLHDSPPSGQPEETSPAVQSHKGFFARLRAGMAKTRDSVAGRIDELAKYYKEMDDEFFDELEEILIASDMGVKTAAAVVKEVRAEVKARKIGHVEKVKELVREAVARRLAQPMFAFETPLVLMLVGVNGTGKTTTAGKLACKFKEKGHSVTLVAADTFRAAAAEQLQAWGERAQAPVIRQQEGSDPAAVVFDGLQAMRARSVDVLVCDTAGRLHNKTNLMNELQKIRRVIEREGANAHKEVWLVLDATTGQNGLAQARAFKEVAELTGIVLTKLDGTAKGGVAVAIVEELGLPVRYIGVGEKLEDLEEFDPMDFARAVL